MNDEQRGKVKATAAQPAGSRSEGEWQDMVSRGQAFTAQDTWLALGCPGGSLLEWFEWHVRMNSEIREGLDWAAFGGGSNWRRYLRAEVDLLLAQEAEQELLGNVIDTHFDKAKCLTAGDGKALASYDELGWPR